MGECYICFADDILLLAPSDRGLRILVDTTIAIPILKELRLNMKHGKSSYIDFKHKRNITVSSLLRLDGFLCEWDQVPSSHLFSMMVIIPVKFTVSAIPSWGNSIPCTTKSTIRRRMRWSFYLEHIVVLFMMQKTGWKF